MRKSQLVQRRLHISERHANRLLSEGSPRVAEVAELSDTEVAGEYVHDILADIYEKEDSLGRGFGCWCVYFDELTEHGAEVLDDKAKARLAALVAAYNDAGLKIHKLYSACDELLRLFYTDIDEACRETEREEAAKARKKTKRTKPTQTAGVAGKE